MGLFNFLFIHILNNYLLYLYKENKIILFLNKEKLKELRGILSEKRRLWVERT